MSVIMFCIGIAIGSFLNVVILRMKGKKNFIKGRSYCPECRHKLVWYDNIPLLSFALLRGKCRYCGKKISLQYPAVEMASGILFLLAFSVWKGKCLSLAILFSYFFFTAILIIIFVYDFRWYLIPDKVSAPAIIFSFGLNLFFGKSFLNLFIASCATSGFFLFQFLISKGRWIGGGDIRMGFLMGAMLGAPGAFSALFISYILGASAGIFLMAWGKKKMQSRLPFGTFLAVGTYVSMLWGHEILSWYINLIR